MTPRNRVMGRRYRLRATSRSPAPAVVLVRQAAPSRSSPADMQTGQTCCTRHIGQRIQHDRAGRSQRCDQSAADPGAAHGRGATGEFHRAVGRYHLVTLDQSWQQRELRNVIENGAGTPRGDEHHKHRKRQHANGREPRDSTDQDRSGGIGRDHQWTGSVPVDQCSHRKDEHNIRRSFGCPQHSNFGTRRTEPFDR